MNDNTFFKNFETKEVTQKDGVSRVQISVDAGSSETRTHTWSGNPRSGVVQALDSSYSVVNEDISQLNSQSTSLYDNLEIKLSDITDNKEFKVFDSLTIVKGGLLEDLRLPIAKTSSNTGKGYQDTTYINTIANIAIRAYMMAVNGSMMSKCMVAELSLALPQEDVISSKRQDEIKSRMNGLYSVEFPRLNYKIEIAIDYDKIFLFDEAQAALGYWKVYNKVDTSQYSGVLIIDAGGRSVDLSLMLKGRVISKGSHTCKFGGQKFIDIIIDKYVNETGNDMPTREMVLDSLDTGLLQNGNSDIDITRFIDSAKEEIVKSIMSDIGMLLDVNDVRMSQLNLVVCAGRLMGESKNAEHSVPSMSTYIEREVMRVSPNTMVGQIDYDHALVLGLSLARFAFDRKNASK